MNTRDGPGPFDLSRRYVRLRADASVETMPVDDTFWQRLMTGALGTFHHEYLVAVHECNEDWTTWEMHPYGDEVVCLLDGAVTFVLERAGGVHESVALAGSAAYVVVPKGTWHTVHANAPSSRLLFITAGEGTRHRAVDADD